MIAREDGSADWILSDQDYGFESFFEKVDTLLMGRKTFEQILSQGPWPFEDKTTYVFSRTLGNRFGPNVQVINRDPATFVEELKEEEGGRIWLAGGAQLARSLMAENLVDDVTLNIHSEMLGEGIELYPLPLHSMFWELKDSKEFNSGLVQVRYRLKASEISFD